MIDGETLELEVFPRVSGQESVRRIGVTPAEPMVVAGALEDSPAAGRWMHLGFVDRGLRPIYDAYLQANWVTGSSSRSTR